MGICSSKSKEERQLEKLTVNKFQYNSELKGVQSELQRELDNELKKIAEEKFNKHQKIINSVNKKFYDAASLFTYKKVWKGSLSGQFNGELQLTVDDYDLEKKEIILLEHSCVMSASVHARQLVLSFESTNENNDINIRIYNYKKGERLHTPELDKGIPFRDGEFIGTININLNKIEGKFTMNDNKIQKEANFSIQS